MANPPGDFQGRIEYLAESLLKGETAGGKDVGALSKSAGFASFKIIKVSPSGPHYDAKIKFVGAQKEKTVVVKLDASALKILGIGPSLPGTSGGPKKPVPKEPPKRPKRGKKGK
ncbi:MAG TPA: hypothetical protein VF069_30030 [Streptosporangiaceae bacterium]